MGKHSIRPNVGGFVFYTAKDPQKVLHTIWKVARVYDAGLLPSDPDSTYLEFEGVTIRIQDEFERQIEEFAGDDLNHEITLEFIDWKKIRPGFFRLWEAEIKDGHIKGESLLELKDSLDREEAKLNAENNKDEAPPIILPWEYIPKPKEDDEKYVFVWCVTRMSAKDMESTFATGSGVVSNSISDVRIRQRKAGIKKDGIVPEGHPSKQRIDFFMKWEAYMQAVDIDKKQKYKNKLIEHLGEKRVKYLDLNWLS